ncbi:MAG: hypothetical protein IPK82_23975 [Polyangiaceae bacterium]|nr:hypothetical protein [Polyangiaceae bacterium]
MDFTAGRRETICDVCAGDLVTDRCSSGWEAFTRRTRATSYLISSRFSRAKTSPLAVATIFTERAALPLNGKWMLAPLDSLVEVWRLPVERETHALGVSYSSTLPAGSRFRADTFVHARKWGDCAPSGAQYARVGNASIVRLSSAEHAVNVPMQPNGQRYPLGFAQTIQPLSLTSLYFGIVV